MKKILLLLTLITFSAFAQNPDYHRYGARTKFVQPDTLSTAQRNALTPKLGTLIYHKDTGVSQWEVWDGVSWEELGGGGGGAVDSVNGQTGVVVLDADDISDSSTTNKFVTATEKGLIATALQPSNNLAELTNFATARSNLGLVIGTNVLAPNGSAANLTNFPTFNQNTTGSAASLTTARTIWGQSFNGTANITGDLGVTGARVPKGWFTDLEITNAPTIGGTAATGTGGLVRAISPTFTGTPVLPSTITLGSNSLIRSGAHNLTFTTTAATNVTLPTSGTLMTTTGNTSGSAATLTTARNFTIGGTAKSFNGSANVTWSTSEIGITKTNIDALSINAASVGGITVTGTPTSGQVLKATSSTAATWDDESGGGSVNTAFRIVSSTSGDFTEEFNAEQPNFQLHLDEDVTIEITDAVNGDFLIANIVNDDVSEDTFKVTLVGTVNLEFELKHGESTLVTMVTDADDNISWVRSYPKGYKPTTIATTATIFMEGDTVYNDTTADAATLTLNNCDAGETLKVYINRASAPTLAGTDLVFNQLPNTTAFEAATDMVITFIVTPLLNSGDKVIDYYYTER